MLFVIARNRYFDDVAIPLPCEHAMNQVISTRNTTKSTRQKPEIREIFLLDAFALFCFYFSKRKPDSIQSFHILNV